MNGPASRRHHARLAVRVLAFTLLVGAAASPSRSRADTLDERFRTALAALDAGRPAEAARGFRGLVALGVEDPDVYLDLGIAEAEAMRYGHAMVAFERALALRPDDPVAARGLENAETLLARRIADRGGEAVTRETRRPLAAFARTVPEPVAAIGAVVGAYLAAVALAALAFARRESLRIGLGIAVAVATLGATIAFAALHGRARQAGVLAEAIVVQDGATARVAPAPSARPTHTLDEGARVTVVEIQGAYVRLAREGRSLGWLSRREIGTY